MTILSGSGPHPLFPRSPLAASGMPHVPLGTFPTPLTRLPELAARAGIGDLWVKRDDLSGDPFGGNKVRKLEFLLGDALRSGAREIVTFGAVGSNHALATAIYGRHLGMRVTLFLTPQLNARYVRQNLLLDRAFGADIRPFEDRAAAEAAANAFVADRTAATGIAPYVIPFGGTTPFSVAGCADAGLELTMQVFQGEVPQPDMVYVSLGSMGTAAGIALGLALAENRAEVRAVRVTPETIASPSKLSALLEDATDLLCGVDPNFACLVEPPANIRVVEGFFGEEYARFTPEGEAAVERAGKEGIRLEGTYTGKTFAALLADAAAGELADKTVVFWDTYNSRTFPELLDGADYRLLPSALHRYFTEDVQELDRDA